MRTTSENTKSRKSFMNTEANAGSMSILSRRRFA
ncbi:hypothetical protein C8P64_1681 [Christiangramia gaetbulicola]|uniref:Uncharacterized protein n=1 Tax=Christiangramia gaetbulicola TaxID=703340 RepID=A0A2T6AH55_9FLAO|nr:hypothetical protein C8P64_1680 [Christiangramia gaetbulicola]PTX43155.1 hypothetical protein C8P64_1681 [Christiangramia gaetbulicola]